VTEDENVRIQLERLARQRSEATQQHREASAELRTAMRRALDEGIPATEVARLAGVSRAGLYKLLRTDD
jgi:DNA-binding phage protein